MNKRQQPYHLKHFASSLLMLLLLSWLTVCLPYVNEDQQLAKITFEQATDETPEADCSNPLSNTNEEKSGGGLSLLSEYLHAPYSAEPALASNTAYCKCCSSSLYIAYHPDMVIPPPEA
jgi:hypothetical protein